MCRCEVILYVQKLRELEDGRVDLHIPKEVRESLGPRIGLQRCIVIHPILIVLSDYPYVKEKVMRD